MSILEEMFVKAKMAVGTVGEKAGNFVDMSKLNISIAEENNALKKKYESLGQFIYKSEKNGMSDKISIQNYVSEIDIIIENINKLQKQVSVLKKQISCNNCGYENSSNAKFCNNCGCGLNCTCDVSQNNNSDVSNNNEGNSTENNVVNNQK